MRPRNVRPRNVAPNCNIVTLTIPGIAFLIALIFGLYAADDMRKGAEQNAVPQAEQTSQSQETEADKAGPPDEKQPTAAGSQ